MRGLGSTGAEKGVVRGTGPVVEADPAESVLTAGIAARHVHALLCPMCRYEAARARTSGLRQYLLCALVTARPCASRFVHY